MATVGLKKDFLIWPKSFMEDLQAWEGHLWTEPKSNPQIEQ